MGKYIPHKIRCKNCKHFEKLDKCTGICKSRFWGCTIFVRPNMQVENCFQKEGAE